MTLLVAIREEIFSGHRHREAFVWSQRCRVTFRRLFANIAHRSHHFSCCIHELSSTRVTVFVQSLIWNTVLWPDDIYGDESLCVCIYACELSSVKHTYKL
uniref:Uncharacterized protein n=1 Tax=Ascaris lumbricoides TaxID=6252 RepID=A0A0M3I5Y2_ASCLU